MNQHTLVKPLGPFTLRSK